MLVEEARWVAGVLASIQDVRAVVDVGSSTSEFRAVVQPHIDRLVFAPLRARGARVVHVDGRGGDGVDAVLDVVADDPPPSLVAVADVVVCANMLEHVTDRAALVALLLRVARPGGHLVVTVPHRYPYHEDPIDTGYRPTPDELAAALGGTTVVARALVEGADPPVPLLAPPAWHAPVRVLRRLGRRPGRIHAVSAVLAKVDSGPKSDAPR